MKPEEREVLYERLCNKVDHFFDHPTPLSRKALIDALVEVRKTIAAARLERLARGKPVAPRTRQPGPCCICTTNAPPVRFLKADSIGKPGQKVCRRCYVRVFVRLRRGDPDPYSTAPRKTGRKIKPPHHVTFAHPTTSTETGQGWISPR